MKNWHYRGGISANTGVLIKVSVSTVGLWCTKYSISINKNTIKMP